LVLNALAFIFAGQTWWQLQINTGDQNTSVNGTGFDADRSISAILMFGLAALLFVAFSRGWTAVVISATAAAATALLVTVTAGNFLSQNIGGISTAVEKHTGISIDPILSENVKNQITGELQVWAWLTLVTLVALGFIQVIYALRYRVWARSAKPKNDRTKPKQNADAAEDTIALWDNQRS
jgi:Na+/pantothenate symporter